MPLLDTLLWYCGVAFVVLAAVLALVTFYELRLKAAEFAAYGGAWTPRDKVVVITGASSGIGEEMARQCAAGGAHVVLAARRVDKLKGVSEACAKLGAQSVLIVECDVSKEADCKKLADLTMEKHSVIDCVFANAGLGMVIRGLTLPAASLAPRRFADDCASRLDPSVVHVQAGNLIEQKDLTPYHTLMQTNYFGVIWTVAYALPGLRKSTRQPKIMVVSSIQGKVAPMGRTGYNASKWALQGFFEALRQELRTLKPNPISVFIINPGPVCPHRLHGSLRLHRL
jgi:NAD(P)-dependent dehydrogenase (short-subunit alcohol dehydrogenase family)